MQIKLDKLGITVEFVAGQIYELEFDGAAVLKGKYCFVPNIGFKPMFDTTVVCVKPLYVERNCTSISNLTDEEFAKEFSKVWSEVFGSLIFKKSGFSSEPPIRVDGKGTKVPLVQPLGRGVRLNDITNTDEQEIKKLSCEIETTFHEVHSSSVNGWGVLARKMYYPKKALDEALASEREYFGLLRQIGQHLGVNVGTDVGVTELPDLVKDLLIKNAQLKNEVELHKQYSKSAALQHTDMDEKLTMATELVDDLSDICRKLLKTSYTHTGVQGVHPGQAELFKALGEKLGVDLPYL